MIGPTRRDVRRRIGVAMDVDPMRRLGCRLGFARCAEGAERRKACKQRAPRWDQARCFDHLHVMTSAHDHPPATIFSPSHGAAPRHWDANPNTIPWESHHDLPRVALK